MPEPMPLGGYSHIEFWVGNALQGAHYYRTALGFTPVAYAGPETGVRDRTSWVLEQGAIRLVLTAGLGPDHEVVRHHARHGDGVRDVAFCVPDAAAAFERAVAGGAAPHRPPALHRDGDGEVRLAAIRTYGETVHSFVERGGYQGAFLPGYRAVAAPAPATTPVGLEMVDHVVANVEEGRMDVWARFYADVMGFSELAHFDDAAITTEYSALMSKVVWDGDGLVKMPINEPAAGRGASQVQEYLDAYGAPGVQHLALTTRDIVATVAALRANGIGFVGVPDSYYDGARVLVDQHRLDVDVDALAAQGVMVDADDEGHLLQTFTQHVQDRPTVFIEVIERRGARGFGEGNFKALFSALEREQAARGNL